MKEKLKKLLGLEPWEEKIQSLPVQMDDEETKYIIRTISAFVNGTAGPYDWDDLMTAPKQTQEAERISAFCASLDFVYPPEEKGRFCSPTGEAKLEELLVLLKKPNRETDELLQFLQSEKEKAEHGTSPNPHSPSAQGGGGC